MENWNGDESAGHVHAQEAAYYNVAVSYLIRDFKPEDFETLWRLDQTCFSPGISYSRQELTVYIRRKGAFTLVAADATDGRIAGFIVVHESRVHEGRVHGGRAGHVITIDVAAEARRAGVGSLLMRAAEERLRTAGAKEVGLETAVDNIAALAFYKRHGYNVIRTWPRYYANGVDALVMSKQL